MEMVFAHSVQGQDREKWELLADHLQAVGSTAAQFASSFGAEAAAQCMGLFHDIGKCSDAYQAYIRQPQGDALRGPDHSTAGAREAVEAFGPLWGRLLAYGIAGHHSGLMDSGKLDERLAKALEDYVGWQAHTGIRPYKADLVSMGVGQGANTIDKSFSVAFLARMLFSCLVDADFLETERFYAASRGEAAPPRGGVFGQPHLDRIRAHLAAKRNASTDLNRLRGEILDHATSKAALEPGLFTLTVPTGGGKTLTSLSFAAEHAIHHELRRIIYVIPFTSIIEQTAQVFRDDVRLGDDVLEHHSNFDWDRYAPGSGTDEETEGADGGAKLRRDAENWNAPLIVTTSVQFFESLFAARTSRARKLHNIAGSVIILDEVQSLPVHLLRPCLAAIDELAKNYGASVVLCTATQPALRTQDGALPPKTENGPPEGLDIPEERELAPDPKKLYDRLKRVAVDWSREPVGDEAIAARFAKSPQMLCIVNSRAHARELFEMLRDQGQAGAVHLSTLMCARHRRKVLDQLRKDLKEGQPVRLVSTSLIEAGVDIDFPEVWRAATGLASIAQAAGRCNREAEAEGLGRTVVFEPTGHKVPPMIEAFYTAARPVLRDHQEDVLELDAINEFYKQLYWNQGFKALDRARLPDGERLAIIPAIRAGTPKCNFPFASVAQAFRMIDDTMVPVIIPYDGRAEDAIRSLRHAPVPPAGVQRVLQQYVALVPRNARASLLSAGAAEMIRPDDYGDRFVVLSQTRSGDRPELYDEDLGLRLDADPTARSSESNILS
ncbi:MAG TPA: CRISPR-associated endonuclease Cas3'' [Oceanicaulis sp.]|uniref:CRISPR-associated helicase/endonuclease Cas3 n=2 Tax=Glycocaulis albus TaxID=1382801 RepID=A0ABQ1XIT9_9PROT|nr:CRISPR-associated helicase/endonuclease Cas3 [Glycocaulis albus]HCY55792.1 CRISPR-associated endonuclease Cas3'' [Oceanicaulis sp.]